MWRRVARRGEGAEEDGVPILNPDGKVNWHYTAFVMSFVVVINWTLLQVCMCVCVCVCV